jgi:hypothetical protein
MKRVTAVMMVMALLSNCVVRVQEQNRPPAEIGYPVVPVKQVGEVTVIDAEKGEQLGFFPGIEGFEEARFIATSSGGYELEVVTESNRFASINNDSFAVAILYDYIDNYDEFKESREAFEKKWKIVDYDELGFPITSYEVGSVKNRSLPWIFGGGCLLLGALPIAFLTMLGGGASPSGGEFNLAAGSMVIAGGVAASIALGAVIGNGISNRRALNKIKESRKLRPLEKR